MILHILRSPYYSIFHVHFFGSRRYLRAEIALWDYFLLHLRQRRTSSYPGSQAAERVRCERESGGLNARSSSITISSRRERKADAGGAAAAFDGTRFRALARASLCSASAPTYTQIVTIIFENIYDMSIGQIIWFSLALESD
jgi:hypothetical protein